MSAGAYRGKDAKLYRNTGTRAAAVWAEIENVRDLSLPMTWGEGDVSTRASDWMMFIKAMITAGVDFGMVKDLEDADYLAILAAFYSPTTAIEFAVMNGDITVTDNRGVRMFCQVFGHTDNQNLAEGQLVDVSIKPTRWYEASVLVPPLEHVVSGV